ncbi:hypothetical protein EBB79_11455 [Parasedimentitalea marina]|uniref:Uncharacterized protein n=1 Tax=Parasedimentitalea marina TaxID=2483033 RepID=A0A3T0N339_9RHOB|nr:hypothetical protein [Parasedimentitalea marina]AZV78435.1 hypothetical protein EBB79_11455 [Parasedimentitalea marina]
MMQSGLWIGGVSIGRGDAQFLSLLKYACIPEASWEQPAFSSGDVAQVMTLADNLSVEIISSMINDYLVHEFETTAELAQNISLRKGVIAAMSAICSGEIDGDYAEGSVGIPPTLGYLENLEVLYTPEAATGEGILTTPAPFEAPDCAWERLQTGNPWVGNAFVQNQNIALSEALDEITPFRGECAGALQLSVLKGCLLALGAEKLDALSPSSGPAFIGLWHVKLENSDTKIDTLATRFLTQLTDVPEDYTRSTVIGVPGDYFYFKNKDDYPSKAPIGGWQGENCIYMGQDALGGPHYSGLGLGWKTEFALRMFLGNAYFNDCNADYIEALRQGEAPQVTPAIVEEPQAQIRFTSRGVMRYPEIQSGAAPKIQIPTYTPQPLSDAEYLKRLMELGFQDPTGHSTNQHLVNELPMHVLVEALEFPEVALHQSISAGMTSATLHIALGHWTLTIRAKDPKLHHISMHDLVEVVARSADQPVQIQTSPV